MRLRVLPLLGLVAALAWGTAGWALHGWRARQPRLAPLAAEVATLARQVARLTALPPAPRLEPLPDALSAWLATVPARTTLRGTAEPPGRATPGGGGPAASAPGGPHDLLAAARPVPGVDGAEHLGLRLQLSKVGPAGLGPALAEVERWPERWAVELSALLWDARTHTLSLALVLYGTAPPRPGGTHGAA